MTQRDSSQQAYTQAVGTSSTNFAVIDQRDPTPNDIYYPIGKFWINQAGKVLWYLNSQSNVSGTLQSTWLNIGVSGTAIDIIDGDTGSITGSTVTIFAGNSTKNSGSSVSFVNSGTTSTLNLTDGFDNTFLGSDSGELTVTGNSNTAVGFASMASVTSGSFNTAYGLNSLIDLTTGYTNTAIGIDTLDNLKTGSSNIALGDHSGSNYAGAESNNICIGNAGVTGESGVIRIGNSGTTPPQVQTSCFIAGIVGVTNSNAQFVTINSMTGQLGVEVIGPSNITWNLESTNFNMSSNNGYFCVSPGGALTASLPATSVLGDIIRIVLDGATSFQITQGAGQQIRIGSLQTTSGGGGSITSTAQGNTLELVCETANLRWVVLSSQGNFTVV